MPTEIKGVGEMRKALRKYTPDLNKALNKELRGYLRPLVVKAKSFIPADTMSGWAGRSFNEGYFPTWNAATAKRGIGFTVSGSQVNNNGFKSSVEVFNKSREGAIFETAGRVNPKGQPWVGPGKSTSNKYSKSFNPNAGEQFIANLERKSPLVGTDKLRGRAIMRAYKEDIGKAQAAVVKALKEAKDRFNGKAFI